MKVTKHYENDLLDASISLTSVKELNNKTNKTYGKKRNDCKADC